MNPNDFSPKVSPAKATLHPNLQVALSSLNVNLEEELARFRQEQKQRKGITIAQSQSESPPVTGHASLISSATDVSGESETSHETDFSPPDSYLASSEELLRHLNQEGEKGTFPSTERLQNQNHQQSPPRLIPLGEIIY